MSIQDVSKFRFDRRDTCCSRHRSRWEGRSRVHRANSTPADRQNCKAKHSGIEAENVPTEIDHQGISVKASFVVPERVFGDLPSASSLPPLKPPLHTLPLIWVYQMPRSWRSTWVQACCQQPHCGRVSLNWFGSVLIEARTSTGDWVPCMVLLQSSYVRVKIGRARGSWSCQSSSGVILKGRSSSGRFVGIAATA